MQFFGCLGVFLFAIILLVFGALRNIYNAAFGQHWHGRRRGSRAGSQFDRDYREAGYQGKQGTSYTRRNRKSGDNRVFPDNVGEYVDFEEC